MGDAARLILNALNTEILELSSFGNDSGIYKTEPNMTSQCFPASHGIPARVVLYRMPLQTEAPTKLELQLAVRDELVARIAELYGRRPEEIDPDWGL